MPFEILFPRTPGGGSGAAARTDQILAIADAESSSTGTTVSSWVQSGSDIAATMTGAGSATYDPDDCDYIEWALVDGAGDPVTIELEDVISVLLRVRKQLPADAFAAVVLTSGGMASIGGGVAAGLAHDSAGGNFAIDFAHAGSAWDAATEASVTDELARVASLNVAQSNGASGARISTTPIDGGLRPATATNTTTAPGLSNIEIGGKFTHVAIVVGWTDTGGTNGVTATVGANAYVERSQNIPGRLDSFEATPAGQSGTLQRFVVIGNSQVGSGGSGTDADRGGDSIPTSVDFSNSGTDITTYPNECASRPYLVDEIVAQGDWEPGTADFGWIEWWGSDGLGMTPAAAWRSLLGNVFQAVIDRGDGDPQLVIVVMGENDADDSDETDDYIDYMRDALRAIRYEWPDARILLWEMSDADTGNSLYSERDVIRAHQATLAGELDDCEVVQADGAALSDDVHYTTGSSGGHATMASRTGALLVAS